MAAISFSGFGWIVPFIIIASHASVHLVYAAAIGLKPFSGNNNLIPRIIGVFVAAPILWFTGRHIKKKRKTLARNRGIDEKIKLPQDTFCFRPIQWWAPVSLVIGVIMIVQGIIN